MTIESEVQRIRGLLDARHYAEARAAATALLAQVPENRDVLYALSVSQRYLHDIPAALATLRQLERHHPAFSRLHQERGFCHVVLRDAPAAIDSLLRGVNINPALPLSWNMLVGLYRMTGDTAKAQMAADHVATLQKLPPEVVAATSLFADGDLSPAESIIRAYLLKHGNHIEAMRLLARIGIARDVPDDAELLLEAVLSLAPDYRAARFDYARALLARHRHQRACEELKTLLQLEPANRQYLTLYATALVGVGEQEEALTIYRQLLIDAPDGADLHLSVAHSLKTIGRREESIAAYRAAAAARPDFGDAYWSLANLKIFRFTDAEIEQMQIAASAPGTRPIDRYHLCFALGKALEDRGDHAPSFAWYERGNALKRAEIRFRIEPIERNTARQIAICTRDLFARQHRAGKLDVDQAAADRAPDMATRAATDPTPHPSRDAQPIFIVGLPRSGSTLLEQILASHPMVEGTQELADVPRIALELTGRDVDDPRYPAILAELTTQDLARLGQRYLDDTRVYRTDKPYFIDKMPNNFRHVGLIRLMLPNALIIDARREPMACCFSNFKQLFASGQEFTYGIEDIARYYRTYLELMHHWNQVMPGQILTVLHEDVVENLEGNVRRLLDFCGLAFDPACIEFYKTARSVRTASSEQVRQPIFRDGLDQWKHYEPWLGGLRDALGDALQRYR